MAQVVFFFRSSWESSTEKQDIGEWSLEVTMFHFQGYWMNKTVKNMKFKYNTDLCIYGCFLKCWYPTTMGFPTKNDHFGVFWGYHHSRKHPYKDLGRILIYHPENERMSPKKEDQFDRRKGSPSNHHFWGAHQKQESTICIEWRWKLSALGSWQQQRERPKSQFIYTLCIHR